MKRQLEPGRISRAEVWFLMTGFLFGSSVLLPPGTAIGRDAWAAVAVGTLVSLPVAYMITTLSLRFPRMTFVEISDKVFGRIIGKIVGAIFLWYLMHLASLILTNFGDYFATSVFRFTPEAVLSAALALTAVYTLGGGLEVLARCSLPIVCLVFVLAFVDTALLAPQINLRQLLPMFETPPLAFLWDALGVVSFPCAEVVAGVPSVSRWRRQLTTPEFSTHDEGGER
ncbi:MAG: GerAB/ArcD/ProY family transporter [Chloroflexota bacterium]